MNYSQSRRTDTGMLEASAHAAQATHGQFDGIDRQGGQELEAEEVWRKLGLTPTIGQNEIAADPSGFEAARSLNRYARANGVGRLSMWSLDRDHMPCWRRPPGRGFPHV